MAAVLLGSASNALALNLASYMPHEPGNQWSYVNNNQATLTTTIGSPVMLSSSVAAIPWTQVISGEPGITVTYNTMFWFSVNWIFGSFVINNYKRRKIHAKKTLQLHP